MKANDAVAGRTITRELKKAETPGPCPSLEDIAALVDGSLNAAERDGLMGHLAICRSCRDTFVTTRELCKAETAATRRPGYLIPSSLAAAAVIVIAMAVTLEGPPSPKKLHVAKDLPAASAGFREEKARVEVAAKDRPAATGHRGRLQAAAPLQLLTGDEAALPEAKNFGFAGSLRQDGPVIVAQDVEVTGDTRTFPLSVGFAAREGAAVDLSTLRFESLKGESIDLTPRIRRYATKDGVKVDNVSLPAGTYRFRLGIGDVNGRFSETEFMVKVTVIY